MRLDLGSVSGGGPRQAGFVALPELMQPWIERFAVMNGRTIPVVRSRLSPADRLGSSRMRLGIGRADYSVLPGLYAVGDPGRDGDVFVSANYKMSFDALRSSLDGLDAWILVLETKGVNVWCAAGKGSFGTGELVSRIARVKLAAMVGPRRLVLPQLGASGVAGFEVARRSGFHVEWGPVRAADIKAWLAAGRKKDAAMREVRFGLRDRLAVAPVELVHGWPILPAALALAALYALPAGSSWLSRALPIFLALAGVLPVGTLAFPALLPWLPTRSFAVKGAFLGLFWGLGAGILGGLPALGLAAVVLIAMPATAFLAMNFTGSSTFTCQPGALLEVEKGFWPMIASVAAGLASGVASRLFGI